MKENDKFLNASDLSERYLGTPAKMVCYLAKAFGNDIDVTDAEGKHLLVKRLLDHKKPTLYVRKEDLPQLEQFVVKTFGKALERRSVVPKRITKQRRPNDGKGPASN